MKRTFKTYFWLLVVIAAAAGAFSGGYYYGNRQGRAAAVAETQAQLQPIIDIAFPRPPAEIHGVSATIQNISGAEVSLAINDPGDYLPHPDGSSRRKLARTALVSSSTAIERVDMTKFDKQGNMARTPLKLSDLKVGDAITVSSAQNIRAAEQFEATRIGLVQF